jgi:hypothetical protein
MQLKFHNFEIFFTVSTKFLAILTKFRNCSQNMFDKITQHSLNFLNSAKILNFYYIAWFLKKFHNFWTHFDKILVSTIYHTILIKWYFEKISLFLKCVHFLKLFQYWWSFIVLTIWMVSMNSEWLKLLLERLHTLLKYDIKSMLTVCKWRPLKYWKKIDVKWSFWNFALASLMPQYIVQLEKCTTKY